VLNNNEMVISLFCGKHGVVVVMNGGDFFLVFLIFMFCKIQHFPNEKRRDRISSFKKKH
jgi:hypothetical protein